MKVTEFFASIIHQAILCCATLFSRYREITTRGRDRGIKRQSRFSRRSFAHQRDLETVPLLLFLLLYNSSLRRFPILKRASRPRWFRTSDRACPLCSLARRNSQNTRERAEDSRPFFSLRGDRGAAFPRYTCSTKKKKKERKENGNVSAKPSDRCLAAELIPVPAQCVAASLNETVARGRDVAITRSLI